MLESRAGNLWSVVLALGLLAQRAESQGGRPIARLDGSRITRAQVDATVERLMTAGGVTGLAIALLGRGEIRYLKGYGFRSLETREPLNDTTVMYGASFTKVVFAYVVMQLVDEGVIDLDKPVTDYLDRPLPEFENYKDLASDDRYKRITARMLLSHTAGFPNWRQIIYRNPDRRLGIWFEPGTKYSYSGEGISLLEFVVERVTGRPVGDLIQERVFDRFGMRRTAMVWRPDLESDYAVGHDEQGRSLGPQKRTKAGAAGSMVTTMADYARFIQGVLRGVGLSARAKAEGVCSGPSTGRPFSRKDTRMGGRITSYASRRKAIASF